MVIWEVFGRWCHESTYNTHLTQGTCIKQTCVTHRANTIHMVSKHISHAQRTCFARTSNTFTILCTCVSQVKQSRLSYVGTRFTPEENMFIVLCALISHKKNTFISLCHRACMCFPGGVYICAKH